LFLEMLLIVNIPQGFFLSCDFRLFDELEHWDVGPFFQGLGFPVTRQRSLFERSGVSWAGVVHANAYPQGHGTASKKRKNCIAASGTYLGCSTCGALQERRCYLWLRSTHRHVAYELLR
jgi:hypothetical protein